MLLSHVVPLGRRGLHGYGLRDGRHHDSIDLHDDDYDVEHDNHDADTLRLRHHDDEHDDGSARLRAWMRLGGATAARWILAVAVEVQWLLEGLPMQSTFQRSVLQRGTHGVHRDHDATAAAAAGMQWGLRLLVDTRGKRLGLAALFVQPNCARLQLRQAKLRRRRLRPGVGALHGANHHDDDEHHHSAAALLAVLHDDDDDEHHEHDDRRSLLDWPLYLAVGHGFEPTRLCGWQLSAVLSLHESERSWNRRLRTAFDALLADDDDNHDQHDDHDNYHHDKHHDNDHLLSRHQRSGFRLRACSLRWRRVRGG